MIETISPSDTMNTGTRDQYFANSRSAYMAIKRSLDCAGIAGSSIKQILDFGCGYGRVLRALRSEHPEAEITATDLMPDAVQFCAETFGTIPVIGQEDVSEISFETNFDLIWVGSVFTHLTAHGFRRMLDRLIGFLAPDGLLVFTTHGRTALWVIEKHRLGKTHITAESFFAMKEDFYQEGFGFTAYTPGLIKHIVDKQGAEVSIGSYGFSCCQPEWVCRQIGKHPTVTLISFHEGGWGKNHDVVTVQRPAVLRVI